MYESDKAPAEDQRVEAMRRFVQLSDAIEERVEQQRMTEISLGELRSERESVRQFLRDLILTSSESEPAASIGRY